MGLPWVTSRKEAQSLGEPETNLERAGWQPRAPLRGRRLQRSIPRSGRVRPGGPGAGALEGAGVQVE